MERTKRLSKSALKNFGLAEDKAALKKITEKDLSGKQKAFGDTGALAVAQVLPDYTSLTTLNLWGDDIGAQGGKAIGRALQSNNTLTRLDLGNNNIGDEGAIQIAAAVRGHTALTELTLNSNNIGSAGGKALGEALKYNHSLRDLYIWGNNLGAEGGIALGEGLKSNRSLVLLSCRANHFGAEGLAGLGRGLKTNNSLTALSLGKNDFGIEDVRKLGLSLQKNSTLKELDLMGNGFEDQHAQEGLLQIFSKNTGLTKIFGLSDERWHKIWTRNSSPSLQPEPEPHEKENGNERREEEKKGENEEKEEGVVFQAVETEEVPQQPASISQVLFESDASLRKKQIEELYRRATWEEVDPWAYPRPRQASELLGHGSFGFGKDMLYLSFPPPSNLFSHIVNKKTKCIRQLDLVPLLP